MTNPRTKIEARDSARAEPEEARVAEFLAAHPDFFEQRPAVLAQLRLPHARGDGSTVSLVERQVEVLRERVREVERALAALVENGRANDALAGRIQALAVRLVRAAGPGERLAAIEQSLREDFGAREFVLVLTARATRLEDAAARCLRVVGADDPGLRGFDSLLAAGKPRCGRVRDSQRDFLFPNAAMSVGSVALVPLGSGVGLLAIASPDVDHFNPTMSTDFLARIGELIATAVDGAPQGG